MLTNTFIHIQGIGVVGIENTHVVTPDGLDSLSKYPDDIVII